ncbi:MAG TPA: hypothetical protein PKZ84_20725 [Anaerolineae bacterium]|nr:hypothetical protein [Anaerolineae bacterium]HQI87040.1 hypothetical protein [Anaerolineae bacterium]
MYAEVVIPRPISEAAEQMARTMEISLSEFFTAALSTYITAHRKNNITELLNQIYSTESSALEPDLIKLQLASVGHETW